MCAPPPRGGGGKLCAALGTIDLNRCTGLKVVDAERRGVRPNSFELITSKRVYLISAETPEDRDEWKVIIEDTIPEDPQIDAEDEEEVCDEAPRPLPLRACTRASCVKRGGGEERL